MKKMNHRKIMGRLFLYSNPDLIRNSEEGRYVYSKDSNPSLNNAKASPAAFKYCKELRLK